MFGKLEKSLKFANNNTCHASHKNSAPGQVFAFFGLLFHNLLSHRAYAI